MAEAQDEMVGREKRGSPQHRQRWRRRYLRLFCATIVVSLAYLPHNLLGADPLDIVAGKRIFLIHCTSCHGLGGAGGVGVNLTDDVTLHGGTFENIVDVVTYGVPGKPMSSWKSKLDAISIMQVSAYVYSLKGTRPTDDEAKPYNYITRRGKFVARYL
jgi:mono/diheme cytochrome c family protein